MKNCRISTVYSFQLWPLDILWWLAFKFPAWKERISGNKLGKLNFFTSKSPGERVQECKFQRQQQLVSVSGGRRYDFAFFRSNLAIRSRWNELMQQRLWNPARMRKRNVNYFFRDCIDLVKNKESLWHV